MAIVSQVSDFSFTVKTWDGELTVGLKHLRSFNYYLSQECQQMQEMCDRSLRMQESENSEKAAIVK
ncbi:hypothetical protein IQ244_29835 [Nostoc sp. LEGE 06077]|uniref:hypothetical protein n=1 Tax=Nostoc sp. LEGE 06077 TaxID=915325 RepID=UPI00188267AD|nr:hypothetical protein [Nostoc sp. LEGE 06077]MBE9210630.1 hypothetical protein [Nostoc sp. LEGE 06077]